MYTSTKLNFGRFIFLCFSRDREICQINRMQTFLVLQYIIITFVFIIHLQFYRHATASKFEQWVVFPSKHRVRNLKFATSKTLVNFMKKMMFLSKNWYFSVQKALIYYTVNKSHHNSFILLVFSHVANFRYVANFRFLTLIRINVSKYTKFTALNEICN